MKKKENVNNEKLNEKISRIKACFDGIQQMCMTYNGKENQQRAQLIADTMGERHTVERWERGFAEALTTLDRNWAPKDLLEIINRQAGERAMGIGEESVHERIRKAEEREAAMTDDQKEERQRRAEISHQNYMAMRERERIAEQRQNAREGKEVWRTKEEEIKEKKDFERKKVEHEMMKKTLKEKYGL